ncbi:MAG: hypothetical protein AB1486_16440 [Planctomycetota bacterium]
MSNPARQRVLLSLLVLLALLVAGLTPFQGSLSATPGSDETLVLLTTFDTDQTVPENFAEIGELRTATDDGASWAVVAGSSGRREGAFLLTTESVDGGPCGDRTAAFGLRASFGEGLGEGVLDLSFSIRPKQKNGTVGFTLSGERGVDILGLKFDGEGRICVGDSTLLVGYRADKTYVVEATLAAPHDSVRTYQVTVFDVEKQAVIGCWTGTVAGGPLLGARWTKPAGSAGSWWIDEIEAWWLDQSFE